MSLTLFESSDGLNRLMDIINKLYELILNDDELKPYFKDSDLTVVKKHQMQLIGSVLGGPEYEGRAMADAHKGLNITEEAYNKVMEYMKSTFQDAGVPDADTDKVLQAVLDLKNNILGK